MKKKGITLVELIVFIGLFLFFIIVFVFPAFQKIRDRSTEVICISNLRQIGLALLMYAHDHGGFVPPYCNAGDSNYTYRESGVDHEGLRSISFKAKRWRRAFDPYVRDNGIFFCPKDPFAGLPPEKTPTQGLPERSSEDMFYATSLDHSVTSYGSCPTVMVEGEIIDIEYWFAKGYYLTTNIYRNMASFPRNWLYAPMIDGMWTWEISALRLHAVTVFATDYTHFFRSGLIELFYDGSVDFHTGERDCYIWRQLEAYYKPKGGEKR